mmetsp:Transcript_51770/g.116544  ORF Transcript_51770/g.116544 Transcript_51770/m.116544 type:complete len:198 (+) Transcript_51770:113-706(+)
MARASGTLALPPTHYGQPKGHFWKGVGELERYPPTYLDKEDVFDEYMSNKSMMTSRHAKSLSRSRGLLELHYDTMRKRQQDRASRPTFIHGPTMDRPFAATTGYSGFIPGKDSTNVCGCTFANGSRLSHDVRGKHYDPPLSGIAFTFPRSPNDRSMGSSRSHSLPQLHRSSGGSSEASRSPFRGTADSAPMMPGEFD